MATVTPNNNWPVPTSTDFVKDGATAIESLGDAIDASVGTGLLAWTSWAPTLSGGWLNGNGTWTAVYSQVGKVVNVYGLFTVGTTTTKGLGMTVSLPVTGKASRLNSVFPIRSNQGAGSSLLGRMTSTTSFTVEAQDASGTYVGGGVAINGASVPQAWVTGQTISFLFTYEAA